MPVLFQFIRKYESLFFALLGGVVYVGCREYGAGTWAAVAAGFLVVAITAALFRRKTPGTKLD